MRHAWALLLLGCAEHEPMAWPVGVTYEVQAPCLDPAARLIVLRDAYDIQHFDRWTFDFLIQNACLLPETCPISTHDEVEAMLAPPNWCGVSAAVSVRGRDLRLGSGRVETSTKTESPQDFVRDAPAFLGPGPYVWTVQVFGEWDMLSRVVSFFRNLGVREVRRQDHRVIPLDDVTRERPWTFTAEVGPVELICQPKYGGGVALWIATDHEPEFLRMAQLWNRR